MKEEITNLKRMNTWILVDRHPKMKVLKGTWAFKLNWSTQVIDYTNAFPQDNIDTDIYVEPPALFGSKTGQDKLLKLRKSMYGLK